MARIWPTALLLATLAGCQTQDGAGGQKDITGRNLGHAAWRQFDAADAKTRFPGESGRRILYSATRYLPMGQYQELFRIQVGLAYATVQMVESGHGGFPRALAGNEFRILFRGGDFGGGPVPHQSLEPELVDGVQQAKYMSGTRPCLVFYRAAGHIIGAAFGIGGTAYLVGGACGPLKADPVEFNAEMISFAAGIKVGRERGR